MFNAFERMIAWRYLRAKKAEGFVSVIAGFSFLGIMLGVATLIIVMSVMNGFRSELIGRILGLNGHINISSYEAPLENYQEMANQALRIDGVKSVIPAIERQALLSQQGNATGVIVRGISQSSFKQKKELYDGIIAGNADKFGENNIAIGSELAKKLRLTEGSTITLISPQVKAGPFGLLNRYLPFLLNPELHWRKVKGTLHDRFSRSPC